MPVWEDRLKPYLRYENAELDQNDPVFVGDPNQTQRYIAGVRWDLSIVVALKVEYRKLLEDDEEGINQGYAQFSLVF